MYVAESNFLGEEDKKTQSGTQGDRRYVLHKQAAVFKNPTEVMDTVKKPAKKKYRADVCNFQDSKPRCC